MLACQNLYKDDMITKLLFVMTFVFITLHMSGGDPLGLGLVGP